MPSLRNAAFVATITLASAPFPALCQGHSLSNAALAIGFATSSTYTSTDADRVDSITWQGSHGAVSNFVANGGPQHCNDPQEYFGQAYGDGGSARPYAVVGGTVSKWTGTGSLAGATQVTSLTSCDVTLDAFTHTSYRLSTKTGLVKTLKITRTFNFKTPLNSDGLRAYVPRLPLSLYPVVLAPDANGVVQTYNAGGCGLTNWNGTWFADDDGNGNGIVMLRSPTKNRPALVVIDNDSFSGSNNTSVALQPPQGGWTGTYTEVEYMCFYDATTWPAAQRNLGKLPKGCTGVSIK
jgi:hypothetical protein